MCYGSTDVELADDWRAHVDEALAKIVDIASRDVSVYSSPLLRCMMLAERFAATVKVDHRLREFDFGQWELKPWDEIPRQEIEAWLADIAHYAPPGGENLSSVFARSADWIDEIVRREEGNVVVITHGGVIRCLLAKVMGLPLAHAVRLEIDYASVSEVHIEGARVRVRSMNR